MSGPVLPAPLKRPQQTFSGQAVDALREMVLLGRFESGRRLNEVELASALGISRGPLREAIQRLRGEGLLTAVSGSGTYVRTFTAEELCDLCEVDLALEAHAVRLATANHLDADSLRQAREPLEADDRSHPVELDFHQRIVALAGNPALLDAVIRIHRQMRVAGWPAGDIASAEHGREHRALVDHMAAGRADEAVAALTEHLRRSLRCE